MHILRLAILLIFLALFANAKHAFLKGLLIGSLLGHKKSALFAEKHSSHESKDYKEEYHAPPEKEYIPVPIHEEPKYLPIYIIKECKKDAQLHSHDHFHHNHLYADDEAFSSPTIGDVFGEKYDEKYDNKYGEKFDKFEGYESRVKESNESALNINISTEKN